MDSSIWSEEKRKDAGKRFAERLDQSRRTPTFRAKSRRINVATDLSVAVVESQMNRTEVAERAGMKLALLSRQLSGNVNLTLDSIGRICEAMDYDFDVILRKAGEQAARQPWERRLDRTTLVKLVYGPNHRPTTFKTTAVQSANDSDGWRSSNKQTHKYREFSMLRAIA